MGNGGVEKVAEFSSNTEIVNGRMGMWSYLSLAPKSIFFPPHCTVREFPAANFPSLK